MKTSALWRGLAFCVLLLAAGLTVYRAKTQPIAHDEALEYEWFLDGGVYHVLQYNPANHILFTLIAKPIVWTLGRSEFLLRLPSLFGTAIYLLVAYLLCRKLFGDGILLFLSVVMLCLNPQILDFMPAARGYILGLAGLVVAMCAMAWLAEKGQFNPEDQAWKWGCAIASVALAMSVLGNFTNVVPVASLVLTFSAVAMGGFRALLKFRDRKLRDFASWFLVPGAVAGFCFLWPYLIQARWAPNKTHFENAALAARDIFNASFLYEWTDDIFNVLGAVPSPPGSWQEKVTDLGAYVLFPLLFLLVGFGLLLALRKPAESRGAQRAQCQVFAGAAVTSVLLIVFLRLTTEIDYPFSRYCLFLIPLFTVGGILAAQQISARFPRSYLRAAGLLIAAIVVFDYALSLQVTQFRYNAYDVISLKLYQTIAGDAQRRALTNVRVGGTWWYEPEINFYRRKFNATWMAEYDVKDKSYFWQSPHALEPSQYDYFVFTPASDPGLTGPHVRTVFHDSVRAITVVANDK
jgi:4-amino-4-deoxy-L-arabinose transferase-like glycosyltransferase